jgi:hypothetical protein
MKPIDLSGMSSVSDARAAYLGFHKRLPAVEPEVWARPATWEEIPSAARWAVAHAVREERWWVTHARGTPDPDDLRRACSQCGAWCRITDAGMLYKHGRPACGGDPVGPTVAPVVSSIVAKARSGNAAWVAWWDDGKFAKAFHSGGGNYRTSTELRAWLANRSLLGSKS